MVRRHVGIARDGLACTSCAGISMACAAKDHVHADVLDVVGGQGIVLTFVGHGADVRSVQHGVLPRFLHADSPSS